MAHQPPLATDWSLLLPMPSTATSPGSPALTHASSGPDDLDNFLDLSAFESASPDTVMTRDEQDLFAGNGALQDLYSQFYGPTEKPFLSNDAQPVPDASINPILLGLSPEQADTDMSPMPDELDEANEEQPRKRVQPKRKSQPKRKAKSAVADLALPMPAAPAPISITPKDKDAQGHLPHIVFPVPDYVDRPAPEEYAKLSSKEKRQLRNKISARNFRHRRKEYITTLEGEITDRDTTISLLQDEVTTLKSENKTLRTDLDVLKKTVDDLLNRARPVGHAPEAKFNPQKDRSPFASTSSWASGNFGALPNINVHTTLVPPPSSQLFATQRNMNPLMDKVNKEALFHLPGKAEDDSFLGQNPFVLSGQAMDRYRAQLYSKVTHNINGQKDALPTFKPAFFTSPSNSDADREVMAAAESQTAFVAREATNTLVRSVFKSFWQTFSGANPTSVADILAGRSELKIVPSTSTPTKVGDLSRGMQSLSMAPSSSNSSSVAAFGGRKA